MTDELEQMSPNQRRALDSIPQRLAPSGAGYSCS